MAVVKYARGSVFTLYFHLDLIMSHPASSGRLTNVVLMLQIKLSRQIFHDCCTTILPVYIRQLPELDPRTV